MPACSAPRGFGELRTFNVLTHGVDYRYRQALGLRKGQTERSGPGTTVPDMLWGPALTLKEPWNSSLILRSSRP